jgi:glycosyltransferase involved in cell wall biosynthesis
VSHNNSKPHSILRALLITIYFPPEIGGGSTGAWNRANILHKMGYTVFVLSGFPSYPSGKVTDPKYKGKFFVVEKIDPFVILRIRLVSLAHDGYTKRLLLFLNFMILTIIYFPKVRKMTSKVHLVYSRSPVIFSSIPGLFYSRLANRAHFFYEVPDLWPEELIVFRTRASFLLIAFGKLIAKITYSLPDVIITISSTAADLIKKEYNPRVSVYGIPVGVEPSRFSKMSKISSRGELVRSGIYPSDTKAKFIILYSGIISSAQGVENLAYLAYKLIDDTDIAILIFGDGPDKEKLCLLKQKMNLSNLFLQSPQPRSLMPTIISGADMCAILLSSHPIFEIALPTKFYEYLACHKPILGICKGELSNIINSNSIGYSDSPNALDNIASYVRNLKGSGPEIIERIESNTISTLQKYTLDSLAQDFRRILENEFNV